MRCRWVKAMLMIRTLLASLKWVMRNMTYVGLMRMLVKVTQSKQKPEFLVENLIVSCIVERKKCLMSEFYRECDI